MEKKGTQVFKSQWLTSHLVKCVLALIFKIIAPLRKY